MTTWQASKARAQLGTVMDRAATEGPQRIVSRSRGTFILATEQAWRERTGEKQNLADFLLNSPLRGSGIRIERIKGGLREIDLS